MNDLLHGSVAFGPVGDASVAELEALWAGATSCSARLRAGLELCK